MKNIDLEIYITNLINFFENNPNDLITLVGDVQKEEFYGKLREQSEKNLKEGNDYILTKEQIVNVVVELKIPDIKPAIVDRFMEKTKYGTIFLN